MITVALSSYHIIMSLSRLSSLHRHVVHCFFDYNNNNITNMSISYSARFYNGYPIFGRSLSQSHTCFRRSYCNKFVGKDTYPYLSTTTRILCHCSSPCFYLSSCDPGRFKCLKSISAKTNMLASTRYSLHSTSMLFTKSGSFVVIVDGCFSIPSLLQSRT
ncbi:hypothetical protein KSP40_PGU017802 [Platanthera guangdongensis]|uniref:Uncharacterized protein n=1 Tax=Platanthera guangdongensis TaxID=2320717 RepID=A0ABR2M5Q6_9ASPA